MREQVGYLALGHCLPDYQRHWASEWEQGLELVLGVLAKLKGPIN